MEQLDNPDLVAKIHDQFQQNICDGMPYAEANIQRINAFEEIYSDED